MPPITVKKKMKGKKMFYNTNCCTPTYLITSGTINGTTSYNLNFRTTPTLLNGSVIKFRLSEAITTVPSSGLPILVNVNINGTITTVPLLDCIGNAVRTGDNLRTRTTYTAVFGADSPHLQIIRINGKPCLGV